MFQIGKNPTLLIFGQNFKGFYTPGTNGEYTKQVRRFYIVDKDKSLSVLPVVPTVPQDEYRRRDLNVVPIIKCCGEKKVPALLALSGVFTPTDGAWTVPVDISADGQTYMSDPNSSTTFKQAMNNYYCPTVELFAEDGTMYILLFGGISFGYFENGQFLTDNGFPFINQVNAIKRSVDGKFSQHLLPTQYPTILSVASNPGNVLLFGASTKFMPAHGVSRYSNGVLKLSKIKKPTVIGYIIGEIQSTLPNTNVPSDAAASPYIFEVILTPY